MSAIWRLTGVERVDARSDESLEWQACPSIFNRLPGDAGSKTRLPGLQKYVDCDSRICGPPRISFLSRRRAGSRRQTIKTPFLAAILTSLLPAVAFAADQPSVARDVTLRSHVIVLAHRSCWNPAPENSVAAVNHCKVVGADAVEMDVRETRDGVLVVMHDDSVDRTTNGTGLVADKTAAEIQALRLRAGGGGPGADLTGEHVPTVEEGLAAVRANGLMVNLHLKVQAEAKVAALVRKMNMVGRVTTWVYGKPDDQLLAGAVRIIPTISECTRQQDQPCWTMPIKSLESYAPLHPFAFFVNFHQTRPFIESVARAPRPAGSRLFAETLNTIDALPVEQRRAEWRWLLAQGVTEIMTNEPGDLISVLNSLPAKMSK